MMNNGKMPLLQNSYPNTPSDTICKLPIQHVALFFAAWLSLTQIAFWIVSIAYGSLYSIPYEIWCTSYIACFILAQTKRTCSGFVWPIRIHFFIWNIVAAACTIGSTVTAIFLFCGAENKNNMTYQGEAKWTFENLSSIIGAWGFVGIAFVFLIYFVILFSIYRGIVKYHHYKIQMYRVRSSMLNMYK